MKLYNRFFYWSIRKLYKFLTSRNPGVYIQNFEHIHIGKNVFIGPGVAIIARNHKIEDPSDKGEWKDVTIEDNCWIGANAVILPGVHLGPHTIVGAGAVVTKSFPKGYCVVVGNPAKKIKDIKIKK